jgi:hypothetical protein
MAQRLWLTALLVVLAVAGLPAQERSEAEQIRDAVRSAPESMQEGAEILGYGGEPRPKDSLTLLREGTNDLVCLADDPVREDFHTACYHRSLEGYMALGRQLREEGKTRSEIMDARYAALDAGRIGMPARATLYSVTAGSGPDPATDRLTGERRLVVVYVPGATGPELGLPTRPEGDMPWLMLPDTPWAHIMIGR